MKRVLITGATGFVGSHALEAMMALDDIELIAACRDRERLLSNFKGEVRVGNLMDADYRQQVLDGVDVVIHAMAWTSLWGHAETSHERYLSPTIALIDAAKDAGVERFINISTTSAAAPENSQDPMSHGIKRSFWPHLRNVIAIEDHLRRHASPGFTAVNMRLGIFAGRRYALGILPILVPRLKTHLVPWIKGGRTRLPITDGRDIGRALALAATVDGLQGYEGFNIVGPSMPTVREVISLLHTEFGYSLPHFSVPFSIAYAFAVLNEWLDRLVPWEPLVTRSIVHLLEETGADNGRAERRLGYVPEFTWDQAVMTQMREMQNSQAPAMKMYRPIDDNYI
ncbi:MAG: NAD(P)-dependent oxidoreductase [Gammaproteobacteria bacterium]|nr:NAD(P)-dependent oxidoreductase [Gammaproteobacteria bacterium]